MNVVSFFSGAGGLDLGFKKAGYNIIWANEFNKEIYPTHKRNFPDTHLNTKSILDLNIKEIPDCDGIIGGPPCQSFSQAGKKLGSNDPRGKLFFEYIKIIEQKKPKFFVAENVSGLLNKNHSADFQAIQEEFLKIGYTINAHLYNANDYGVPQDRYRLIIVGYLKSLNQQYSIPHPLIEKPTLEVIKDMPVALCSKTGNINREAINNHEYMLGTFSSMFMSRNRVRKWNEPSFTILATARQIPIHPSAPLMIKTGKDQWIFDPEHLDKYRRMSVRECARIQTFPDNFCFEYSKIEAGYKMIGNAVPVNLGFHIAKQIKTELF